MSEYLISYNVQKNNGRLGAGRRLRAPRIAPAANNELRNVSARARASRTIRYVLSRQTPHNYAAFRPSNRPRVHAYNRSHSVNSTYYYTHLSLALCRREKRHIICTSDVYYMLLYIDCAVQDRSIIRALRCSYIGSSVLVENPFSDVTRVFRPVIVNV